MALIGPRRLQESGLVDAVTGQLGADAVPEHRGQLSSLAPSRSGVRKSVSPAAKRQLRSWPSAVSRTRSQLPQNGEVTEAMTPTVAGPPST